MLVTYMGLCNVMVVPYMGCSLMVVPYMGLCNVMLVPYMGL